MYNIIFLDLFSLSNTFINLGAQLLALHLDQITIMDQFKNSL